MSHSRFSSVDWEEDIYSRGEQLNHWPYSKVVSAIFRETSGLTRQEISILELGCGAGNNVWFMAAEGFKASGIDMSVSAISYALDRFKKNGLQAELVVGDIVSLPWPDEKFDIVLDRGAITQNNHKNIKRILRESFRVLKPSGVFLGFTLKGMNHPERLFGEEVAYHTYDNFTKGGFAKVGLTSFFTEEDIYNLFGNSYSTEITKHLKLNSNGEILDEEYSVRAIVKKK